MSTNSWFSRPLLRALALVSASTYLTVTPGVLADLSESRVVSETPESARLTVGGASIDITISPGQLDLPRSLLVDWIGESAVIVRDYYDRFPVAKINLSVNVVKGRGVVSGRSFPGEEPLIMISIGAQTKRADLREDWILVHEMVHLAFPSVANRHHWIEEGLATYVEPLARAEVGALSTESVWEWMVVGLPKGLPMDGDRGLDHTPTWGRTYWGGALFCLLADLEIRKRTQNRYSLKDSLRAIVEAGGTMNVSWPVLRALEIGDLATGVAVLVPLYNGMKSRPVHVDLQTLWSELGVARRQGQVIFDDDAPLAWLRQSITESTRRGL